MKVNVYDELGGSKTWIVCDVPAGAEHYPDEAPHVSHSEIWHPEDLDINLISNQQLPTSMQGNCDLFPLL
jgi:hypothetical protein